MKNKVLATLLAVCLFAGLAVPAFAASSTQEGAFDKVTAIEFSKKEVTVKQDSTEKLANLVTAFVGDEASVLAENAYLEWSVKENTADITVNSSTGEVTAVSAKGSATVVATSNDGKIKGEIKVICAPADAFVKATGFKLNATAYNVPLYVAPVAGVFTATLAGTYTNAEHIFNVAGVEIKATPSATTATGAAAVLAPAVTAANAGKGIKIGDVYYKAVVDSNTDTKLVFTEQVDADMPASGKSLKDKTITAKLTSTGAPIAGETAKFTVTAESKAGTAKTDTVEIKAEATPKDAALTNAQISAINGLMSDLETYIEAPVATTDGGLAVTSSIDSTGAINKLVIGANGNATAALKTVSTFKKVVDFPIYEDVASGRTFKVNVNAKFTSVEAIEVKTIAVPGTLTLEVGEKITVTPNTAPSASNQDYTVDWVEDVLPNKDVYDYAIVTPNADNAKKGDITAVAVGSNKITATLKVNGVAVGSSTIVVNVVKKGTKPTDTTGTTTTVLSNWTPKLGVGETANIVVKATAAVTYTSLATDIVTVDAAGKLTAVKEGTAKVKVQEEGKDAVYLTVTIGAATTKPADKPTDVPQTAVAALIALF